MLLGAMTLLPAQNTNQQGKFWDRKDLIRRLYSVLEVAEQAVGLLVPLGFQDPDDPTVGVTSEKVVSETALLLLASNSVAADNPEIHSISYRIAKYLIPYARNKQVLINLCLNPALTLNFTSAHICLSRLGFPDLQVDKMLQLASEMETVKSRERLPHRLLEQNWLKRLWTPSNTHSSDSALATLSMLGQPMDVFFSSRDDIYAFTHAIMYISDFGERKVRLPRLKKEILADAEAALCCCLDKQDYDLCGELLLAWPYLGEKWSSTATFAFHVLTRIEDAVGFLPSPLTQLERYKSLSGERRARYAIATVYHTAYVMGLLCAALLRYDCVPPLSILLTRCDNNAQAMLKVIDNHEHVPHWQDDFSKLEMKYQNTLVPMLVTIAMKRAVVSRDYEQVRSLLVYSLENRIINYPAIRQAADLLRRIAQSATYSQTD